MFLVSKHNVVENMTIAKNIANYVRNMGINLSELSRKSGVAYGSLYATPWM